jgi:hypothetical protein
MSDDLPQNTGEAGARQQNVLPPDLRGELEHLTREIEVENAATQQSMVPPTQEVNPATHPRVTGFMDSLIARDMKYEDGQLTVNGAVIKGEDPAEKGRYLPHGKGGISKEVIPVVEELTTLVADLTNDEEKKEYERVLSLIANSMGTYLPLEPEREPEFIADPQAPKGYRVVVILKYAKVTKLIAVDQPRYDEIDRDKLKEEFFHYHEPLEVEDRTSGSLEEFDPGI